MASLGSLGLWAYAEESWDSELDSTWEDDEDFKLQKQSKPEKKSHQHFWSRRAAEDLQRYRHGYPLLAAKQSTNMSMKSSLKKPMPNLQFYRNEIPFEPNGVHIDKFHNCWKSDYCTLESNTDFISWLFPLREPGVNRCAIPLTEKEIEEMKKDGEVMKRFLESYKLMLGFYGIQLVDSETGRVTRAPNWAERFLNLNTNSSNNLRITRILKCLGELGYERYQVPLVRFFLEETLCNGKLPNVKRSALNYFMFTVKNKSERKELVLFAWQHYEPKEKFIWGPVETLRKLSSPAPVGNPKDESKDVHENISLQKNGRDCYPSNHANGKEIKKRDRKVKTMSKRLLSEHGSVGKESTSQGLQKCNVSKESRASPTVFEIGNEKEYKESPAESGSGNGKENRKTPTECGLKEDKEKGEQPMQSGTADDRDNKGPTAEWDLENNREKEGLQRESKSEDEGGNGKQPMKSRLEDDQDNKGQQTECKSGTNNENRKSPIGSRSEEDKEYEEQPIQSGAADDKDDKGPPTECKSENNKENRKSPTGSRTEEEKDYGEQPMQSGAADDKDNKGPPTESESGNIKKKGGPLMESSPKDDKENRKSPTALGSEEDKENKLPPTEWESGNINEKGGPLMESKLEDDKENREPPTDWGFEEDKENGEQPMQSGASDDMGNKGPPAECESRD